jgi:sugar/nucleoside kinase (ribokinase family)
MNSAKISIVGIGFICLDIIRFEDEIKIQLGGTTANVASVLSELSLQVSCFVPQYSDLWNEYLQNEIVNRNIRPILFTKTTLNTPRVIEVIEREALKHKFFTVCPQCKKKLNNIVLPSQKQIESYQNYIENTNVLFFDRVSEGVKRAVEIARLNNSWVFYEPNACRFYKQLLSVAMSVDILKYSEDRISPTYSNMLKNDLETSTTKLIIITLGNKGIKYCCKSKINKFGEWKYIKANNIENIKDTCGAGDWLTAAFLYYYLPSHLYVDYMIENEVEGALVQAQHMAAFACGFIGAQEIFHNNMIMNQFNTAFNKQLVYNEIKAQTKDIDLCEYCKSEKI